MLKSITSKQQKVLSFYENYLQKHDRSPTYQEAGDALNVSPSVVFTHIKNLEKKGYLVTSSQKRSVTATSSNQRIPLIGSVACGEPIAVLEECEEYIEVPESMAPKSGSYYALRAVGQSMKDAGINNGDNLIIQQQNDINDGDIGVVVIGDDPDDESATLKRVYHTNKSMILKPANDNFPTTVVKNGMIRGKLAAVIRRY